MSFEARLPTARTHVGHHRSVGPGRFRAPRAAG